MDTPESQCDERDHGNRDFISALPDSLLCHILSFVPTNNAVATSVLAKRWKLVWTNVPNLVFDFRKGRLENLNDRGIYTAGSGRTSMESKLEKDNNRGDCSSRERYTPILHPNDTGHGAILSKVLSLNSAVSLDTFHLTYRLFDLKDTELGECIDKVVARGVRDLEIECVYVSPFFYGNKLPRSLFNCKNLVTMRLCRCYINIPSSKPVCLLNLKKLYLDDVKSASKQTLTRLIAGCPVLEYLTVKQLNMTDFHSYKIHSQTLKFLNAVFTGFHMTDIDDLKWDVEAPLLTSFYLSFGKLPYTVVHVPFGSLHKFSNLKWLGLRCNLFYLLEDPATLLGSPPMLPNLEGLELGTDQDVFFRLLRNAVNLKHLKVEYYLLEWSNPPEAPECLKSSIETISIVGFSGQKDQLQFIKYLIANGKALKKISVCCDPFSCDRAKAKRLEAVKKTFSSLEYHVHEEHDDLWKSGCYVNSWYKGFE